MSEQTKLFDFFDCLDEQPCSPKGVFVRAADGEVRITPPLQAFAEWRSRNQSRPRRPRLEAARLRTALLGHLLAKEERTGGC